MINDIKNGAVTIVKRQTREGNKFPVTVGLHQGLSQRPYWFTLTMDELIGEIKNDIPCLLMIIF